MEIFGEPLDQALLGRVVQLQELPSAANSDGKALVPPKQDDFLLPRNDFGAPFPCPVSN